MKGKFILRNDKKPNEFGEYGICLYYAVKKVPVKKSMGIFIHPDLFCNDGKTDTYILGGECGHPKADIYNKVLARKKNEYDQIIEDLERNKDFVMTVPIMRSILNGTYKQEMDSQKGKVPFVEEVLNVNRNLYEKGKISYSVWHNVECSMNVFKKFLKKKKKKDTNPNNILYCCDITVELIEDYIEWRKDRDNSNATINHSLTPIFKTIRKMMRLGWIKSEVGEEILDLYLPTQYVSLDNPVMGKVEYLTIDQLKLLIKLVKESKYPRTKELMDLFFFSFYCGGLRFSDVCTLRWLEINLEDKLIKHLQVKNHTKKPTFLTLPINKEASKILKRWIGKYDNFVFGMLPDDFDLNDYKTLKLTLNSRNKTMNQSLKSMGEKMGLSYNLHFHIARHSWASYALNQGIDIKTISTLLGHSTTTVTERIYAKLFPDTLKSIVEDKLDFSLD